MPRFEYKLVPAPEKATKHKGLKGAASFAATLEDLMNALGRDGWHYLRADTLPEEVRTGLTSRTTTYRNILIFQRQLPEDPPDGSRPARLLVPKDDTFEDDPGEPALANLFADPDDPPAVADRPEKT